MIVKEFSMIDVAEIKKCILLRSQLRGVKDKILSGSRVSHVPKCLSAVSF